MFKQGDLICKKGERIKELGLIVQGSVILKYNSFQCTLEKGHIIGIAGCNITTQECEYIAKENTVIMSFEYRNAGDFMTIFKSGEYGNVFILAALKQSAQILGEYERLKVTAKKLYQISVEAYRDYKFLCNKYQLAEYELSRMDYLSAVDNENAIPIWKEEYYKKLVHFGLKELKELFTCNELCIGTIEMAGEFLMEMIKKADEYLGYIEKSRPILLNEKKNDMFQLMFDLESRVSFISKDKSEMEKWMGRLISFIEESHIYEEQLKEERISEYKNFDFAQAAENYVPEEEDEEEYEEGEQETCLVQILKFAEYEEEDIREFEEKLQEFSDLPDKNATDGDARVLRKWLSGKYYEIYKSVLKKALESGGADEIISMFLNFGFMDVNYLGGGEMAEELLDLLDEISMCNTDKVYTFYEWLKTIYLGENEPCINELDMDYKKHIKEAVRQGDIPSDKEKAYLNDNWKKVEFELDNLFVSGGKVTCGHITTFCPILGEDDVIGNPGNMLVTALKIKEALTMVKNIDFGIFYREVMFSDKERGIGGEYLNVEVMPKFILLPNAGSKGMMWQVTEGVRNSTASRFLLPILCSGNLNDIMIENCGRYRWEMCRKIQGARWNDVTTPSLTSEYSDYLQYYRKNYELSADAKEKVRNAIKRARNRNREVFVKDYENWIKFEANGSFRLNRVARRILFEYCPFGVDYRENLKENPMYQESISKFNMQNQKKVKKINAIYKRYEEAGGTITDEMNQNLEYYNL